jgi:Ca2+-binding EF-hand superfamily protein
MDKKVIYKISLIVIISIFLIICTTNSFAQEKRGKKTLIQAFDKDNDGRVSRDEFTLSPDVFNWLDRNKDDNIDKNEQYPIWYSAAQFIIMFDSDMDGKVSREEIINIQKGRPEAFKRMDKNDSGYIEITEVAPPGGPQRTFADYIQIWDVDRDGKVSKYEVGGFPRTYLGGGFTLRDKNKDGYVEESEFIPPGAKGGKKGKKGGKK